MRSAEIEELFWTPEAWALREASRNPVYPYEWEVRYVTGARFKRVCNDQIRVSAMAPREHIQALRVIGPVINWLEVLPPPGVPDALVIQARVLRNADRFDVGGIAWWRFGFLYGDRFVGVELDAYGRVSSSPSYEARSA